MEDKKLEPFKISDTRKPSVNSPKKAEPVDAAAESPTLGFRRIEGMLEREDPAEVRASLADLKENLTLLAKSAENHRDKAGAKRAIVAVDRTTELVNFLFETRESLQKGAAGQEL
jgi:hypothetical protein